MIKKIHCYLFSVFMLTLSGCIENKKSDNNIAAKDSVCIIDENRNTKNEQIELDYINEGDSNMINISTVFSSEEIDKIRLSYIKQLRFKFQAFDLADDYTLVPEDEWRNNESDSNDSEISDKEKFENMDVIYRILLKKHPIFKPVSKELFKEKMKSIFCIDVNNKHLCNNTFYTNQAMTSIYAASSCYNTYIDLKNRIITFGELPLLVKEEVDWEAIEKKLENIERESINYCKTKENLYEEYLNEALQKKFTLYCSKIHLEYLYHVNNYVFYENQASLSWLLANEGKIYQSFTSTLFDFFNYDKEPRINRINMDYDISKGFPLYPNDYERVFGVLETCPQTQYYNHFQFKVRTGLMQYIVDNCYDETDLDTFGIRNDKYICVMEDCFDYLMGFVLKGDKYKESEQCHYYQVCAYLAYYLQKAYENFVSQGNCDPRCWHNALANNLRKDINDNDARFENYVKDNDYFRLEGFEEIMKKAHEEAMMD